MNEQCQQYRIYTLGRERFAVRQPDGTFARSATGKYQRTFRTEAAARVWIAKQQERHS